MGTVLLGEGPPPGGPGDPARCGVWGVLSPTSVGCRSCCAREAAGLGGAAGQDQSLQVEPTPGLAPPLPHSLAKSILPLLMGLGGGN